LAAKHLETEQIDRLKEKILNEDEQAVLGFA
jgi:hypothetical protein